MKTQTTYNENILSLVLNRQESLQRYVGTNWWYSKSTTSRVLYVLEHIGFWFTIAVNFLLLYSYIYTLLRFKSGTDNEYFITLYNDRIWNLLIPTVTLGLGFVLSRITAKRDKKPHHIKKNILLSRICYIINILSCVLAFFACYTVLILQGTDVNPYAENVSGGGTTFRLVMELVFLHGLPLLFIIISSLLHHIMRKLNLKEINQMYEAKISAIYTAYTEENPEYTQVLWEEYLDSYEEPQEDFSNMKRSKKARKRKEEKEENI